MQYQEEALELLVKTKFTPREADECREVIIKKMPAQDDFRSLFIKRGGTPAQWADIKVTLRSKPLKSHEIAKAAEVFIPEEKEYTAYTIPYCQKLPEKSFVLDEYIAKLSKEAKQTSQIMIAFEQPNKIIQYIDETLNGEFTRDLISKMKIAMRRIEIPPVDYQFEPGIAQKESITSEGCTKRY